MDDPGALFVNGQFIDLQVGGSAAEAMAASDGRIAALGSRSDVAALMPSGIEPVDLQGGFVIPGFNDCHMHILPFGLQLQQVDLRPEVCPDIGTLLQLMSERRDATPDGSWIRGRGYNHDFLTEGRHPTVEDLDRVSTDHPVVVGHTSGHVLSCNTVALKLAAIDANTPDPQGGQIERDEAGLPTGVLKETAMPLLLSHAPVPNREEARDAVLRAMERLASEGITSATDASTGHDQPAEAEISAYVSALESETLRGRIGLMPQILYVAPPDSDHVLARSDFEVGDRPDWLSIVGTKIFADGAITTRTAALRTSYPGTENQGIPTWKRGTLTSMVKRAHDAGWQIGTHAMGDLALEMTLDAYAAAQVSSPRFGPRHRIEHCSLPDPHLTDQIRSLGVVPVVQPELIARFGDSYIEGLGRTWAGNAMPLGWFKLRNIAFALSSDRPVVSGSPLVGIQAAVLRKTPVGETLGPEHRLTVLEAIRGYTAGSAYATFCERNKGRLSPGFLADFVVLDQDITKVEPEAITELHVVMTVVGGRIVYDGRGSG